MLSARNASNPLVSSPHLQMEDCRQNGTAWQTGQRLFLQLCPPNLADLTPTRPPPQYSAPFLTEGFHQRSQRQSVPLPQLARVKFLQASLCYSQPPTILPTETQREVEQRKVTVVGFKTNPPFQVGDPPSPKYF